MPIYDFVCDQCKREFTVRMRFEEYGGRRVKCPKCRSAKVRRPLAVVGVRTSKKS